MSFMLTRVVPAGWCCLLLAQHAGCARSDEPGAAGVAGAPSREDRPSQRETTPDFDSVNEVTPPAPALPDPELAPEPSRPWGDESLRILVEGRDRDGLSRFEAERQELTPAQLLALDGLRIIPTSSSPPIPDDPTYQIRITDRSGGVVKYRAADSNAVDGDEVDLTLPTIDWDTLGPFLAASHCLAVQETRMRFLDESSEVVPDAGAAPWPEAPLISSESPGCFHAVALPNLCNRDVPVQLYVETAGTYRLSLVDCREALTMVALSPLGSVELGAASGSAGECPELVQLFPVRENYPLLIRKQSGCEETSGLGGQVFLRVRR